MPLNNMAANSHLIQKMFLVWFSRFLKSNAQMPCESSVHMEVYYDGSQQA